MKLSSMIEAAWVPSGLVMLFHAMPHVTHANDAAVHVVGQLPTTVNDNAWMLYCGYIATGLGLLGMKAVDVIMYWRNKNKETAQGKLSECLSSKEDLKVHYEERLKGKDEIIRDKDSQIAAKDVHIDYFKKLVKDITTNPTPMNIVVAPTTEKIETPQAA